MKPGWAVSERLRRRLPPGASMRSSRSPFEELGSTERAGSDGDRHNCDHWPRGASRGRSVEAIVAVGSAVPLISKPFRV